MYDPNNSKINRRHFFKSLPGLCLEAFEKISDKIQNGVQSITDQIQQEAQFHELIINPNHISSPIDDRYFTSHGIYIISQKDPVQIEAIRSKCTHLGCDVLWNQKHDQFKCPCHGSQFSIKGAPQKGPAERFLEKIPLKKISNDMYLLKIKL